MKWLAVVTALAFAYVTTGCSLTVMELHPRPSVSVAGDVGKFTIDVTAIPDDFEPGRSVHIHQFKKTLANGLKGALGDRVLAAASADSTTLVFKEITMEFSQLANVGVFLLIRFSAKWVGADGKVISEVNGTAKPVNVTESGPRHVEDAVEVMYGQLLEGLDKAMHPGARR